MSKEITAKRVWLAVAGFMAGWSLVTFVSWMAGYDFERGEGGFFWAIISLYTGVAVSCVAYDAT